MSNLRTIAFLVSILPLLACQQHEDPPDLVAIATGYCKTLQMCDPDHAWESQEKCESYSAEVFEKTKTENKACYDSRIIMETCLGEFESCDEYAKYKQDPAYECRTEVLESYAACLEP